MMMLDLMSYSGQLKGFLVMSIMRAVMTKKRKYLAWAEELGTVTSFGTFLMYTTKNIIIKRF